MGKKDNASDAIVIKKYANRRLYDTSTSQYVTLDYVRKLVKEGADFTVVDAKSGEDLTHSVLSQIIFEEEARGENLLPLPFLRQLIQYYDDSLQSVVPSYLQATMEAFAQQQEAMRERFAGSMHSPQAMMDAFQEQTRRNMEMFGQAVQMFNPYIGGGAASGDEDASASHEESDELKAMRAELDAMRAKIDKMSGN
ncbi:polyhydroxyalkanoate synthesis repressor PhaR [Hyphobacterium sp. HN65]|uniref:Polyhydroxyalkanoate synthesis repressor PhaR n=1 Tax=Hyphobacterium lacteum TaxID=3116575 RepID=A0ABU7LQ10_9PROT|nr:polyhydroxyalkanoate synthesis repressor PhaR [Hyphobacterium sp. HN65]MEE2525992.1 polyhydroxyalkanoate synthesis repressor PhaR [Hyphobacterium sp. HN65]